MATLSIKNVPDEVVERLRERARRNHRSMQGELRVILETAVQERPPTIREIHEFAKTLGLRTPSESVEIIRRDRDGR